MGRRLGACMGTVTETDIYELHEKGPYIRAAVEIDIDKPILPGINGGSKRDGVFWVDFKCEKLLQFCYGCGRIGHDEEGCNEPKPNEEVENCLGPWMRTSMIGRKVSPTNNSQQQEKSSPSPHEEERRKKLTEELLEKLSSLTVEQVVTHNNQEAVPANTEIESNHPTEATGEGAHIDQLLKPTPQSDDAREPTPLADQTNIFPVDATKVLSNEEKRGGNPVQDNILTGFRECVQCCELIDLGFVGDRFTWDNRQHDQGNIKARLDRALATSTWRDLFPAATLHHLGKCCSYHSPILLDTNVEKGGRRGRCKVMRFEQLWASDVECKEKATILLSIPSTRIVSLPVLVAQFRIFIGGNYGKTQISQRSYTSFGDYCTDPSLFEQTCCNEEFNAHPSARGVLPKLKQRAIYSGTVLGLRMYG
ncbi:Zinc finger, CCHC-type [Sesbania bispinosa]|nr:Zinc finger, CCHC-type [Sesbania bispinosa]